MKSKIISMNEKQLSISDLKPFIEVMFRGNLGTYNLRISSETETEFIISWP